MAENINPVEAVKAMTEKIEKEENQRIVVRQFNNIT